jgi:hypothetical protein
MTRRQALVATLAVAFVSMVVSAGATEWQLWLPPNGGPVKAVFVCPRWGDGARMAGLIQQKLGQRLGVATMLTRDDVNTFKESEFLSSITNTLATSALALKRPELANAPLLLWAHSNAAAYLLRCLQTIPDRVVAYCLFKSAFGHNNDFGAMSKAAIEAFGQSIWDENDRIGRGYDPGREKQVMLDHITAARKQGALIHVTLVRGTHHVIDGQENLMLAFFETALVLRVPPDADPAKGPVKLMGGREKAGWVQDPLSKAVYPYASYPAGKDPRQGWWLPARDYAAMWNGYALNAKGTLSAP